MNAVHFLGLVMEGRENFSSVRHKPRNSSVRVFSFCFPFLSTLSFSVSSPPGEVCNKKKESRGRTFVPFEFDCTWWNTSCVALISFHVWIAFENLFLVFSSPVSFRLLQTTTTTTTTLSWNRLFPCFSPISHFTFLVTSTLSDCFAKAYFGSPENLMSFETACKEDFTSKLEFLRKVRNETLSFFSFCGGQKKQPSPGSSVHFEWDFRVLLRTQ